MVLLLWFLCLKTQADKSPTKTTSPPGDTVVVEEPRGTTTDFDGNYQIEAQNGQVLVFSYVGYADQQMTVGAADRYDVQMQSIQN